MPDERNEGDSRAGDPADLVGALVRAAGRRPEPPSGAYARTLDVATAALRGKLARRRRRAWALRAVAVVLAAVTAATIWSNRPAAPAVARLERAIGAVDWAPSRTAAWSELREGAAPAGAIGAGSRVRVLTGARAGLVLADGTSLRLAANTEIEIEAIDSVVLREGVVYVDSSGGGGIRIVTANGTARDVGTQFEVASRGREMRLRVREGRVRLSRGELEAEGRAGEEITVVGDNPWQRREIAASGPHWQWVESVAPAPEIDGQPLRTLLDWVARETGRPLRFASPGIERLASTTRLHGTVRYMAPMEALAATLATTDLDFDLLDDGTILIDSRVTGAEGP
jgi:ferric-dicitrate binding protein FerR (iron transport regulator)